MNAPGFDTPDLDKRYQFSGQRMRQLRRQRRMPMIKLAVIANRSTFSLTAYEKGRFQPPVAVAYALARGLEVPVSELMEEVEGEDEVAVT
jgi:transcriptional regulator with XRE-family HTH domain